MADLRYELGLLMEAHGKLTAEIVVDAGRPVDSPLHDQFLWDDQEAGERYRLVQARQMIRSVRWVYREATEHEGPRSYRTYSSTTTDEGRAYLPTAQLLQDPFQHRLLVQQMRRDMAALRQKYEHLEEWAALLGELAETG